MGDRLFDRAVNLGRSEATLYELVHTGARFLIVRVAKDVKQP